MRLSPRQHKIIIEEAKRLFPNDCTVRLFGSRVNDNLYGGDIDLLLSFTTRTSNSTEKILQFNTALQKRLGEQKIDIISYQTGDALMAVHQQALKHGIIL